MNDHIGILLSAWGRREQARLAKGLGYPSVSPMFAGCQFTSQERERPHADLLSQQDLIDTDIAAQRLDAGDRAICFQFYVVGGKSEEIAKRLSLSKTHMYSKLEIIKRKVMGHLNDISAGI